MVALATAAMPSSRPVNPSRSLVVAFTATRDKARPVISAMRARIMSRSGPIFGRSQISVTSRWAMRPPRAVTRLTAYFRNWSDLGIARRKMRTDIAVRERAEDGVDQRVEADVTVGMREKAFGVRHADAADHHMIALAKGMNVVAVSGSDIAEHGTEASFLADKVFRCRQFHVGRIAFKCRHRQSRPFRKRRVVGEIAAPVARRAAMGVENHIEPERLRRLRDTQPRALRRRFDVSAAVDQFDGIGDRYRGNGRAGAAGGFDRARNQRRRDEWPCGVVDQNDIRRLAGERFKSGVYRGLARCPAGCRRLVA